MEVEGDRNWTRDKKMENFKGWGGTEGEGREREEMRRERRERKWFSSSFRM